VLFVCTANICRSPSAEYLARYHYGEQVAMFRSAGFLRAGEETPKLLATALSEHGVDVTPHRSFQLNEASLLASDLVLTMEGEHVQRATILHRESFPKIVPLKEAAEAAAVLTNPRLTVEDLLDEVGQHRDPTSYLSTRWDVADPYNRKLKDYRRAVGEIDDLVQVVIGRLIW
jgi:protein-tyrosine-phosphatase